MIASRVNDNLSYVAAKLTETEHFQNNCKEIESNDEDLEDDENKFIENSCTNTKTRNALKISKFYKFSKIFNV